MAGEVVTLDRGEGTTLTIHLQGAVISSWRVNSIEQLFTPVTANYNYLCKFEGGITLAFPFEPPCEKKQAYELSRLYNWKVFLRPKMTTKGDVTATFLMKNNLWTQSAWNHSFLFFYRVILKKLMIVCDTRIVNPSKDETIHFNVNLRMNFQVRLASEWLLYGLQGEVYCDELSHSDHLLTTNKVDENEHVPFNSKTFRIYTPAYEDRPVYFLKKKDECEAKTNNQEQYDTVVRIDRLNFPNVTLRYPWSVHLSNTDSSKINLNQTYTSGDAVCADIGHVHKLKDLGPGMMYRGVVKIMILPKENNFVNMTELVEDSLFRDRNKYWKEDCVDELCKDRNPSERRRHQNELFPMSGSLGFGSWSLY